MKLLLLAGTAEARQLAERLHEAHVPFVASLAGVTERPAAMPGELRSGGFGGVAGLLAYIRDTGITHVVDATHPFAVQMSLNARAATTRAGIPCLQVLRPPWPEDPSWTVVPSLGHAASVLDKGSCVFLSTGRGSLASFERRCDVTFLARVIDDLPTAFPLARGRFVIGKPPFSVEEEMELFRAEGVDAIVSRNSGGTGGIEKLIAAKRLGLKIVMVARPDPPPEHVVDSVEAAMDWVKANA